MTNALVLTPAEVNKQIQHLMKDGMQENTHFGKVPGCGDKKALFKAGAEKIKTNKPFIPEDNEFIPIPKQFTKIVKRASKFSSSSGSFKEHLEGVYINRGHIVATDSFDLIVSKLNKLADIEQLIIPKKLIRKLKKDNLVTGLYIQKATEQQPKIIFLKLTSGEVISSEAIDRDYPNFKLVVPEGNDWVMVNRLELLNIVEQAKASGNPLSKLTAQKDKLYLETVSKEDKEKFKANLGCSGFDKEIVVGIDNERFISVLKNLKKDNVCLQIIDTGKPIMFFEDKLLFLSMPVKLDYIHQ